MTGFKRLRRGMAVGALLVVAASCTESDNQLFDEIGVTRLYLLDLGLDSQSLTDPEETIQVTEWEVTSAQVSIDGVSLELAPDGDCRFADTVVVAATPSGACLSGLVIESSPSPQQILLTLEIGSMRVRRAEPLVLSPSADYDGDGVPNDGDLSGSAFDRPCGLGGILTNCDDNCPLLSNADQADNNGDGIGNACSVFDFFFGFRRDSDGDGILDSADNCVWVANPGQEDTMGLAAEGIPDLIGDACAEQIAEVELGGSTSFELLLGPADLSQATGQSTFITVDFNSSRTLSCNWESGTCTLDADQVRLCADDPSQAFTGCPS